MNQSSLSTQKRTLYSTSLSVLIVVVFLSLLSVLPVLIAPRFCILDCPAFYDCARKIDLSDVTTYLFDPQFADRASYGRLVYLFPIYWSLHPGVRYWFYSGGLVASTMVALFWLFYKTSRSRLFGLVGIVPCLAGPAFTENYYTMFKGEPYILCGAAMMSYLLWARVYERRSNQSRWGNSIAVLLAVIAALFVYSIKETGCAFFGVYLLGLCVLGWCSSYSWKEVLERTWWLTLINVLAFGAFLWLLLHLPRWFSDRNEPIYVVTLASVARGVWRLARYFYNTASYVAPALLIWVSAVVVCMRQVRDRQFKTVLGWTTYFLAMFCGMAGIVAPHIDVVPRYLLQASTSATAFAIMSLTLAYQIVVRPVSVLLKLMVGFCACVAAVLLVLHTLYSVRVGQISEGMTQVRFDAAWHDMFRYLCMMAPSNAVVHFITDPNQLEVKANVPRWLRLFEKRDDIQCRFPSQLSQCEQGGLVCVPYRSGPLNYFRLPASENVGWSFLQSIRSEMAVRELTNFSYQTRIHYVTTQFGVPQYKSVYGVPALWDLKQGVYEFGWRVFDYKNSLSSNDVTRHGTTK